MVLPLFNSQLDPERKAIHYDRHVEIDAYGFADIYKIDRGRRDLVNADYFKTLCKGFSNYPSGTVDGRTARAKGSPLR